MASGLHQVGVGWDGMGSGPTAPPHPMSKQFTLTWWPSVDLEPGVCEVGRRLRLSIPSVSQMGVGMIILVLNLQCYTGEG